MSAGRYALILMFVGFALMRPATSMADYAAGLAAFNAGDFATAFAAWDEEAKSGNAKALHGLAILYETGRGVPSVDAKKAAELYQAAADQDYPPALTNLARLYEDGRGVTKDDTRALVLWRRAADLGNATAMYNLAAHYADGIAVEQNDAEAATYFRQAADLGLADAQYAMARILRDGIGVPIDEQASEEWLRKAAASGHSRAKMDLAALAHTSSDTAPQSVTQTKADPVASVEPTGADAPDEAVASTAETSSQDVQGEEEAAVEPVEAPSNAAETTGQAASPAVAAQAEVEAEATQQPETEANSADPAQSDTAAPQMRYLIATAGNERVYRIWLGQSGQEKDAKSQWAKFQQQFPGSVGKLELDLRRYFLGEAKGSIYRIFAGPFSDPLEAEKACRMVIDQEVDQFCRVVIN